MKNRKLSFSILGLSIAGVIGVAILAVGYWLISPLWRTDSVEEAFPFDVPTTEELENLSSSEKQAIVEEIMEHVENDPMTDEQIEELEEVVIQASADMPDDPMEEEMPAAIVDWMIAASGSFVGADDFHQGSGDASIYQLGDEAVLRLENFKVTNGPDLHVLLVQNTSGDMGNFLDLGKLKGNVGNQNYEIPAGTDLSQFSGVIIYCMPFHVIFATAGF